MKVEREPKPWYGVIRWTGPLKIHTVDRGVFAGIEMVHLTLVTVIILLYMYMVINRTT